MNNKKLRQIDKAVYIALVVLAAAAILVAMITGPIGKDDVSIGASVCACLIAAAVLWRTIRAFQRRTSRDLRGFRPEGTRIIKGKALRAACGVFLFGFGAGFPA